MLDYFLGYGMDTPKKPDIVIIGGNREMSFADVNIDEPDEGLADSSAVAGADSSAVADSTENTTALDAVKALRSWNIVRGAEGVVLNAGGSSLTARLFDLNGKLLASKKLQQGASWEIPAAGTATVLQVKSESRTETIRLAVSR